MTATSSRFAGFRARSRTTRSDTCWSATAGRRNTSASPMRNRRPAASAHPPMTWRDGWRWCCKAAVFEGKRIVAANALLPGHHRADRLGALGRGRRATGHLRLWIWCRHAGIRPRGRLSHSGAFGLGAATNYVLIPSLGVGITVLSNAAPIGAVEALGMDFADLVQFGVITRDWLAAYRALMAADDAHRSGSLVGKSPPATSSTGAQPQRLRWHLYTMHTSATLPWYCDATTALVLLSVRHRREYALHHWDGDVFHLRRRPARTRMPARSPRSRSADEAARAGDQRSMIEFYRRYRLGPLRATASSVVMPPAPPSSHRRPLWCAAYHAPAFRRTA